MAWHCEDRLQPFCSNQINPFLNISVWITDKQSSTHRSGRYVKANLAEAYLRNNLNTLWGIKTQQIFFTIT